MFGHRCGFAACPERVSRSTFLSSFPVRYLPYHWTRFRILSFPRQAARWRRDAAVKHAPIPVALFLVEHLAKAQEDARRRSVVARMAHVRMAPRSNVASFAAQKLHAASCAFPPATLETPRWIPASSD